MNIFNWLKSRFSNRGKALSLRRRGMARSKRHDHQGGIEDYTATIGMPDTPTDLKAMALDNRGLVHVPAGDYPKDVDNLNAVLAMGEVMANIKSMARQTLAKMGSRSRKSNVQKDWAHPENKEVSMLVLSRKSMERIQIGDSLVVTVLEIRGNKVRIGIDASRESHVRRTELENQVSEASSNGARATVAPPEQRSRAIEAWETEGGAVV
jgi:carbon storage regulator